MGVSWEKWGDRERLRWRLSRNFPSRASQGVLPMISSRENMRKGKQTSEKILVRYLPLKERERSS